ncbi:MAG TPA: dihydrofolate reductase family protein [Candidatus Dormibacteraeota bacterium]|nr:dihydrofolate reductase family protein [Candidatus Dormibacteraeota bacterium]
MRKIVAGLFISLDGVVEAPDRWRSRLFTSEMADALTVGVAEADAILLGRRLYQEFAAYWPQQGSEVTMADFLNLTPKYVVSSTLDTPLEWANSRLVTGDLAEALTKLKEQAGKNIQVPGSPTLVRSLLREGLLDELSLWIFPVVVGSGMRLFDGTTGHVELELVGSRTFSSGVLSATYRPVSATGPTESVASTERVND